MFQWLAAKVDVLTHLGITFELKENQNLLYDIKVCSPKVYANILYPKHSMVYCSWDADIEITATTSFQDIPGTFKHFPCPTDILVFCYCKYNS